MGEAAGDGPQVSPVDLAGVTALNAPSGRPDEAVTSGAAVGAGPGSAALGLQADNDPGVRMLAGYLPGLEIMANSPQASNGFKQWVRQLRALI
jgi:hypothetical protein